MPDPNQNNPPPSTNDLPPLPPDFQQAAQDTPIIPPPASSVTVSGAPSEQSVLSPTGSGAPPDVPPETWPLPMHTTSSPAAGRKFQCRRRVWPLVSRWNDRQPAPASERPGVLPLFVSGPAEGREFFRLSLVDPEEVSPSNYVICHRGLQFRTTDSGLEVGNEIQRE